MTTAFTMDADYRPFHPSPRKPSYKPPAGAVDAHCHVFGPGDTFPYAPERKYTPCDAPKEKLFELRDFLGFDKNVIVQASCHGRDNTALVDALQGSDGRAKGVAVVRYDITEDELKELDEAGVRGVRFNFVKRLVDATPRENYLRVAEKIAPLGWHIVVYFEAPELESLTPFITSLPGIIVVDHMGRPDVAKGVDHPDFQRFVRLLDEHENIWTKVSCPERLTVTGPPYDDVVPFQRTLVERFPDRVLWGTDWPHPNMTWIVPDDGELVDLIPRIAPSPELQQKLLVDNPNRLYWPENAGRCDEKSFDDIPGTILFDANRSREGYHLNMFCMSLMKPENRDAFRADERAYLAKWAMTPEQTQAILDRDWNRMLELGGNIYYTAKLAACDGLSFQQIAAIMTSSTQDDYARMMREGGRSPEGNRSKSEWEKHG